MRNKDCRFKITRIINNNVLTSKDHQNEVVLMGKGIAWNKKVGDVVEEKNIEKIFTLKENEKSRYLDFIEQIDSSFFEMAIEILDESQKETGIEPNPIAYLMLADHISSAVERSKMGINLVNENLNEIKRFHSKEFNVGKAALDKIEAKYGVRLKLDEAGFIAHHLINVLGSTDEETNRNQFIQKIIELVENYFEITLDKESIPYERFLTHLRYFSSRIFSKKEDDELSKDDFVFRMMKVEYPKTTKCVEMIKEYIEYRFQVEISNAEKGYLMIHINNILRNKIVTK